MMLPPDPRAKLLVPASLAGAEQIINDDEIV
jgi:hypothetical protein